MEGEQRRRVVLVAERPANVGADQLAAAGPPLRVRVSPVHLVWRRTRTRRGGGVAPGGRGRRRGGAEKALRVLSLWEKVPASASLLPPPPLGEGGGLRSSLSVQARRRAAAEPPRPRWPPAGGGRPRVGGTRPGRRDGGEGVAVLWGGGGRGGSPAGVSRLRCRNVIGPSASGDADGGRGEDAGAEAAGTG